MRPFYTTDARVIGTIQTVDQEQSNSVFQSCAETSLMLLWQISFVLCSFQNLSLHICKKWEDLQKMRVRPCLGSDNAGPYQTRPNSLIDTIAYNTMFMDGIRQMILTHSLTLIPPI